MLRDDTRPATRIMIVEDEAIIAMDLRRRLERLGYEITAIADNAEDALSFAAREPPDLVLMDIVIQGPIDGVELAVELGRRGLPVIFLTAHSDAVTLERAKKAHAYGLLVKPLEGRELHEQRPGHPHARRLPWRVPQDTPAPRLPTSCWTEAIPEKVSLPLSTWENISPS